MGILGEDVDLIRRYKDVTVGVLTSGEPFNLRLYAPPLGILDQMHEQCPDPKPPLKSTGKVARDPRGRALKDPNNPGSAMAEMAPDDEDPGYLTALSRAAQARSIALIFACLESATPPAKNEDETPEAYWHRAWAQVEKEYGFGLDIFRSLNAAADYLTGPITILELAQAKARIGVDAKSQEGVEGAKEGNTEGSPSSTGSSASASGSTG